MSAVVLDFRLVDVVYPLSDAEGDPLIGHAVVSPYVYEVEYGLLGVGVPQLSAYYPESEKPGFDLDEPESVARYVHGVGSLDLVVYDVVYGVVFVGYVVQFQCGV